MAGQSPFDRSPPDIELVKRVLRALARRGVYLTTTRAQKLFYLIERQALLETGDRCFHLDYRNDRFGMYSPMLDKIMQKLNPKLDHLEVREIDTERGHGRTIKVVGGEVMAEESLPDHLKRAIAKVLSEWGFLSTPRLIADAKATSPFIYAKKGKYLDWKELEEERSSEEDQLSDEGLRRLEKAEESLKLGRSRKFQDVEELVADLFP